MTTLNSLGIPAIYGLVIFAIALVFCMIMDLARGRTTERAAGRCGRTLWHSLTSIMRANPRMMWRFGRYGSRGRC